MIRQIVCCCVAVAGCGRIGFDTVDAQVADASLVDAQIAGLVVRYPMDDDPTNGSIAATVVGYDGVCGPCPTSSAGIRGGAYAFSGDEQIRLPSISTSLVGTAYSIALWARPSGAQIFDSVIISKPFAPNASDNVASLALEVGSGRLKFESTKVGGTTNFDVLYGPNSDLRNPQAWHHLVASWDGADKRIYIDGALAGAEPTTIAQSLEPLIVGFDLDTNSPVHFYQGELDELRFYSRALTDTEVAALRGL